VSSLLPQGTDSREGRSHGGVQGGNRHQVAFRVPWSRPRQLGALEALPLVSPSEAQVEGEDYGSWNKLRRRSCESWRPRKTTQVQQQSLVLHYRFSDARSAARPSSNQRTLPQGAGQSSSVDVSFTPWPWARDLRRCGRASPLSQFEIHYVNLQQISEHRD
jgi:hypothetical protein